ncbi:MAG: D-alanyl-D-alanine carboxypeptidase [Tetrasphaera sp.]|nr:D-alanyl-D-alanine carboxypeptidase [Tetrasphaera sp.]
MSRMPGAMSWGGAVGHAKKVVGGLIALALLAGGGYAVADARDLVPGVLTLPEPVPTGLTPLPTSSPEPSASLGPAPTREGTAAAIGALLADPSLGGGAGAVVRDITSGEVLVSTDAERPRTIASTQKILSALAITDVLDAESTMKTTVVAGAPGEVVLVAGGDTLLATGPGDPTAVVGRAGLGDLAAQVAAAAPAGPLTVRLDASYAAGPPIPSAWNPRRCERRLHAPGHDDRAGRQSPAARPGAPAGVGRRQPRGIRGRAGGPRPRGHRFAARSGSGQGCQGPGLGHLRTHRRGAGSRHGRE